DIVPENQTLSDWIRAAGASNVHLLGPRADVANLLAGCDVACLSSAYGEGLPNIVVEAMACGLPCVVTDVGDSAWVVGATGYVASPRNPDSLADGLRHFANMSSAARNEVGAAARRRIRENFNLDAVAAQYYSL